MALNWSKLYQQYKGQWIALKEDERSVIVSGRTAKHVFDEARKKGYQQPIITFMPRELNPLIGMV